MANYSKFLRPNRRLNTTQSTSVNRDLPINCITCQSRNLDLSPGKGQHALRADCKDCGKWFWVQQDIAELLTKKGLHLTTAGKQLSLLGGEGDE